MMKRLMLSVLLSNEARVASRLRDMTERVTTSKGKYRGALPRKRAAGAGSRALRWGEYLLLLVIIITAATGCDTILEGDKILENPHFIGKSETTPEEKIEVSDYDGLMAEILKFVMQHEDSGRMYAYSYNGDVSADIERACEEIKDINPIGAYAVAEIEGIATRIVSYYEIDISIEYNRTKQQVDSIELVSTSRYLEKTLLPNVMSEYNDVVVFRTTLSISEEEIIEFVKEVYYENPGKIIMKPIVVVKEFPENGKDKVLELQFGYGEQVSVLRKYSENITSYVKNNTERAVGFRDEEIMLSLANNLIAACIYDEAMAKKTNVHGQQSFTATAYGALVNGKAVGEGFAMAFKALCDELKLNCRIVLGTIEDNNNSIVHAWNIVQVNEDYYHIDVAMCAVNGIETAFLKTDSDFLADKYSWDLNSTIRCTGTMTYQDVAGEEEVDDSLIEGSEEPEEQTGDATVQSPEPSNG
jgi:hypothetical protein